MVSVSSPYLTKAGAASVPVSVVSGAVSVPVSVVVESSSVGPSVSSPVTVFTTPSDYSLIKSKPSPAPS